MSAFAVELLPYVHALGWSLLHFVWQGALIGLAYAVLRGSCTTSAARHRFGMFCLLTMLFCPLTTLALLWPASADPANPALPASTAMASVASATMAASDAGFDSWLLWAVGLWLAGVCLIALRSFLHWRRLAAIVRSATALPRDWQLRLIELRQRFGILRPIRLLASFAVAAPTLIGWFKPTILLPMSLLSGFTPAQIELILAHELAHVRRYDYIANLIQVAVETLLFYHPAVHWISSDVRQQREQCCDDLVLSIGGGQRMAYARTLAELEEWIQREADQNFGTAVPALGASGGVLFTRVQRIVDPMEAQRAATFRGNGLTLPVLLASVGLLISLLRLNSSSMEVVSIALSRASATSAELLAATTFRIHAGTLVLPLQTRPSMTLPRPSIAERETVPPSPAQPIQTVETVAPSTAEPLKPEEIPAPLAKRAVAYVAPNPVEVKPEAVVAAAPPTVVAPAEPQPVHVVQPAYPLDALRNNMAGKVNLEFQIGDDGRVRNVRVLAAQPAGMFEQASIAALRQWRFDGASGGRYTRSFAFTPGGVSQETCREVTGSHICRRPGSNGDQN